MNEIYKKKIEQEAKEYTNKQTGLDYIGESICEKAFSDGADYALTHQWISVNEALPKNGENVFATDSNDAYVAWFDEMDKEWRELVEGSLIVPTYWMPIPKFETKEKEE